MDNWEREQKRLEEINRVAEEGQFQADWDSLCQWSAPSWFHGAKFGIFIHWGLYSIPAHGSEWYSRNMYLKEKEEWEWHRKTYGEQKDFGYKDFIPMFTADRFNPKEWIQLFKEAGARYIFPVAEHHDGFQMYKSGLSKYNTWDMGPGRDILGELKEEAERQGVYFCTSNHRAEHWFFMGHGKEFDSDIKEPLKRGDFYWPAMPEPNFVELRSQPYPTEEFLNDWLLRVCEIIDNYQPSLIYFDWWVQHEAFREVFKKMAAYYYNKGLEWGKEVGICYKYDAMAFGSGIVEVERGGLDEAVPYLWQTDTAIAKNSWCYTDNLDYKTSRQIICALVETVCRNGNMLLNVGPKGDGSIPEEDVRILREIGAWLQVNGEAIYGAGVWRKQAEGNATLPEGPFSDNDEIPYTGEDIRFMSKGKMIYAIVMRWPKEGKVSIRSMAKQVEETTKFHGLIKDVQILGAGEETLDWRQDEEGLHVECSLSKEMPVVVRVEIL